MTAIKTSKNSSKIEKCKNSRDKRNNRKLKFKLRDLVRKISLRSSFLNAILQSGLSNFIKEQKI